MTPVPQYHDLAHRALISSRSHVLRPPLSTLRLYGVLSLGVLLADVRDGKTCGIGLATFPNSPVCGSISWGVCRRGTSNGVDWLGKCVPGGRLCLSFSALSVSLRTRVYTFFEHRTLNLMLLTFLFFFMRAAVAMSAPLFHSRICYPSPRSRSSFLRRVAVRRTASILASADLDELLDV